MEILFIDGNDKQRSLYRIYLENILEECLVHEFFSYKQALSFLGKSSRKEKRPFEFILMNTNGQEGAVSELVEEIHQKYKTVPIVLFSEDPPDLVKGLEGFYSHHPQNSHIPLPCSPADFREKILGVVYPDRMNLSPVPAFQKVRLFNFYRFNKPQCHVYLKLGRMKYVKVFNQGQKYTRFDLEKLKQKDVEFLYIRNEDFQRFQVNFFRNNFLQFDTELATPDELKEKLEFTHAMLHELVLNLGFSEDVIELTEKSLKAINGIVEKDLNLNELLGKFRGQEDYLYDHSYLTSVIACDLLRKMNWWTEERMQILGFASLFHDITLTNPKLARITQKDDPELENYSHEEVKKYYRHPLDAFELVLEYPNIPSKVAEVICQHHETPEGNGFPNALRPINIDPLSAVFILAHDFVNALERASYDQEKMGRILLNLEARYNVGPFKDPLQAFLKQYERAA